MKKWLTYLIIVVIIGASVGGAYAVNEYYLKEEEEEEVTAEMGDQVTVHYTGWLQDERIYDESRIFDTSRTEVSGPTTVTFSERDRGEPYQFTVGEGVIKGWNENVLGAKEGETLRFTIPPKKAYPTHSEELKMSVDRVETLPVYEEMTVEEFENEHAVSPSPNMAVEDDFWGWNQTVVSIEGSTVTLRNSPEVGENYQAYTPGSSEWSSRVMNIDSNANEGEGVIEVKHFVEEPTVVDAAQLSKHKEKFGNVSRIKGQIGQDPNNLEGIVVEVTDEKIKLDFNEEVNGNELTFRMTVIDIQKAEETETEG